MIGQHVDIMMWVSIIHSSLIGVHPGTILKMYIEKKHHSFFPNCPAEFLFFRLDPRALLFTFIFAQCVCSAFSFQLVIIITMKQLDS